MNTAKKRDSFHLDEWWDRVGPLVVPDKWGNRALGAIIGPRDACSLVRLRQLVREHISFGHAVPADVFLLGTGEAPSREWTKIGGLPFWPRDRPWPHGDTQKPLPFLAQFNFRDSLDIVGQLPGDLLVLFGDKDHPATIVAKWQSSSYNGCLIGRDDMPIEPVTARFYGTRWRTESYPDATWPADLILEDGSRVLEPWLVCEILGMQIGPSPLLPPGKGRPWKTERIICSMCAIFPQPDVPWQFTNRAEPLTEQEAAQLSLDLSEYKDADGFAVVCVVIATSGEPEVLALEM